jgi:hypothetical protein
MSISPTPFTPTPLDRKADPQTRNPREPDANGAADNDNAALPPADDTAPDELERAVPPLPQSR